MRRLRLALAIGAVLALVAGGVALAQPENSGPPVFFADLSGDNEVDPVETDTTGTAMFRLQGDQLHFTLKIQDGVDIFGAAGAHIHCGSETENGPIVAFLAGPLNIAGGITDGFDGDIEIKASLNEDSIADSRCGSNLEGLVESMRNGRTYVNVHSAANPGGEIRGQIEQPGR